MIRRALILAIFLLLGAIVSWLVAWVCAMGDNRGGRVRTLVNADWPQEKVAVRRWFGGGHAHYWSRGTTVDGTLDDLPGWVSLRRLQSWFEREARGWPALSHYYELTPSEQYAGGWKFNLPAWYMSSKPGDHRVIPLRPLWRGLALNTLLYATLLWATWLALGGGRRYKRKKRGACPGCGYDLRGADHDVCPECGKPIASGQADSREPTAESPIPSP